MARGRQGQTYNRVSASDAPAGAEHAPEEEADLQDVSMNDDTDDADTPALTTTNETSNPLARRSAARSRQYSRLSLNEGARSLSTVSSSSTAASIDEKSSTELTEPDDGTRITVTILDFAQSKFHVSTNPSWTVQKFKRLGQAVHKVSVQQQRLIYRGKLMQDTDTLQDSGIFEDDMIIHLFPKPRVVINNAADDQNNSNNNAEENGGGARVPTIVLDADEAERRSSILVLGSPDYMEAQNSVKLYSFMLLVVSTIELLNLLTIALGVPTNNGTGSGSGSHNAIPMNTEDDLFEPFIAPNATLPDASDAAAGIGDSVEYEQWAWPNSVDFVISAVGVYVALIGIKASNENTLRLAKQYLWGTTIVGVAWWIFNYYITIQVDETIEDEREARDDDFFPDMNQHDIYNQAFSVMVLPGLLWIMCCVRAFQFQFYLREAEEEAEARIQRDLGSSEPTEPVEHDEELALQNDSASIT